MMQGLQASSHLDAVQARHLQVHQQQVEGFAGGFGGGHLGQPGRAIGRGGDLDAEQVEHRGQRFPCLRQVIDHQGA